MFEVLLQTSLLKLPYRKFEQPEMIEQSALFAVTSESDISKELSAFEKQKSSV